MMVYDAFGITCFTPEQVTKPYNFSEIYIVLKSFFCGYGRPCIPYKRNCKQNNCDSNLRVVLPRSAKLVTGTDTLDRRGFILINQLK